MKILSCGVAVMEGCQTHAKWVEMAGTIEHDQAMRYIRPLINEGDIVLDIGANIGTHTFCYSKFVGPAGSVTAFEPHPEVFECLTYNTRALSNVRLLNVAVGENAARAGMNKCEENPGASHLVPGDAIEVITIDSLNLPRVNLIKIDVEGFEVQVLHGARNTIKAFKPWIVTEVYEGALVRAGTTVNELFSLIQELGYRPYHLGGHTVMGGLVYDIICHPIKPI